jgi:methylase of polypeptide subunit release factors
MPPNPQFPRSEPTIIVPATLWLCDQLIHWSKQSVPSFDDISDSINQINSKYPENEELWSYLQKEIQILRESQYKLPSLSEIHQKFSPLLSDSKSDLSQRLFDILGTKLQRSLPDNFRKTLAANYTNLRGSTALLQFLPKDSFFTSIADPFCGSGRLIIAYLDTLKPEHPPPTIWINDIIPEAVIIAYCRVLDWFVRHNFTKQAELRKIHVTYGDAFTRDYKSTDCFDLILMNPPFTRADHLSQIFKNQLRTILPKALDGMEPPYEEDWSGQPGLHVYSLILADKLLTRGGMIAAVLPASSFLSRYSFTLQKFLIDRYYIRSIAAAADCKAFSQDSQFREILFIAAKKPTDSLPLTTKFHRIWLKSSPLLVNDSIPIEVTYICDQAQLINDRNWIRFLLPEQLLDFVHTILQSEVLHSGNDLHLNILRGIEMYGPDFFFFPNKYWDIIDIKEDEIEISSTKQHPSGSDHHLNINRKFLTPCLRKPALYSGKISPIVTEFALSIPKSNEISKNLAEYIALTEFAANPAKKQFENSWIHHISHQLTTKQPYGQLFFVDKFGINSTHTMIFFTDVVYSCTKNFYLFRGPPDLAKILAAWLCSSWYYLLFLYNRREIGGSYGRMQIMDLMTERIFPDINQITPDIATDIIDAFDYLRTQELSSIPDQLTQVSRQNLDQAWLKFLQIHIPMIDPSLSHLYDILSSELKACQERDTANT